VVDVATIPALPLRQFLPDADPEATIDVPCLAFLVHNDDELLVVDTGADPAAAESHGFVVTPGRGPSLVEAAAAAGFEPHEVRQIVHTHLHYDHVQNDHLFPRAEVVVNRHEVAYAATRPDPYYLDIAGLSLTQLAAGPPRTWRLLDGDAELAPGVRVVHTGGHSPGHQAVVVDTAEGAFCISGDITPLADNLDVQPEACPDPDGWARFVTRVAAERWALLPSHDPSFADVTVG
jgi:glyoxylase-like metal-dependent hydrolase (beta-lactamase superfamily II)